MSAATDERAAARVPRLRVAACVLDLDARELRTADDRPVELRRKALDVLLLLAEHAGRVVDKATLMKRVWPGVVVGDDSLTQTVVEIRRAIHDRERRVLCTVARRGYRLQAIEEPTPGYAFPAFSIAVLPIADDPDEPDSRHWAAVLTAELTARTGFDLVGGKVAARETVAAVSTREDDPRVAARLLGVQQVVCGELRATLSGWSLALESIDGTTGARRWSHRFSVARPDLPAQIEALAAQAARAVLVEMHRMAAEVAAATPSDARTAADVALQGWASVYEGISPTNLLRAQRFFEQAVAKDPTDLRALTGLCIMHWWTAMLDWTPDRGHAHRQAVDIARRLEQLYPGETLTALASGAAADIEGRWALRLSIADRLAERDPANPTAHFARGASLLKLGQFDGCNAAIEEARRLSVNDFRAGWWYCIDACAHLMARRPAQAASAAQWAIAANACLPLPPLLLAAALAAGGQLAEGREALRVHLSCEPHLDYDRAEWLLGHGNAKYEHERARILATLVLLGLSRR